MPKRKYSREFKLSAVKLVNEQGYSIINAGKSLGVDPSNVRLWLKRFAAEAAYRPAATERWLRSCVAFARGTHCHLSVSP